MKNSMDAKKSRSIVNSTNLHFNTRRLLFFLMTIFVVVTLVSCSHDKVQESHHTFRAINGQDTAYLSLTTGDRYFIGNYEIFYGHKTMKDSGYVRGKIVGDTLLGAFYYKSYGGLGLSKPIALLKKKDKLLLGTGVQSSVLGLVFFTSEVPINYDAPAFVFEKFQKKK